MPQYPYRCKGCEYEFDVIKSVADIDEKEICIKCGEGQTKRLIAISNLEKSSMQQPYYEPTLGCVIKGKSHKKQILRQKGLEEVGSTSPDTMYNELEKRREKRMAKEWAKL
jgi:putative FmdB family regulatory protein